MTKSPCECMMSVRTYHKIEKKTHTHTHTQSKVSGFLFFVRLGYQGKDIVFRFITEYSSLRDFGP